MSETHSFLPKTTYFLGDSWCYYKFYAGPKTTDLLLTQTLSPLADHLLSEDYIDAWFFIRYMDPHPHLRFRLHLRNQEDLLSLIKQVHAALSPWVENRLVWRVQTDTYEREIERYSRALMELSEDVFYHDSRMVVGILKHFKDDSSEHMRWLIALRANDRLLNDFKLTLADRSELVQKSRDSVSPEVWRTKLLRQQLDTKYRRNKSDIEAVLNAADDLPGEYAPLNEIIAARSIALQPLAERIIEQTTRIDGGVNRNDLLQSFLHMMNNRFFRTRQNLHELVIYDFLALYYRSCLARQKR